MKVPGTLFLAGMLTMVLCPSCDTLMYKRGNGEMIVNTKYVEPFQEIVLSGNYEVFLESGSESKVVIKVDENLMEYIEIESRRDILAITSTERIKGRDGIKVFITYEDLDKLTSGGASSIFTESPIVTKDLKLVMSGAGMMEMELDVKRLNVTLSGAGFIKLQGSAVNQDVRMSGAGSLEAYELESNNCDISISGVGGAQVFVRNTLSATVSGVGGVQYRGEPEEVTRNVSGLGKITSAKKLNL